MPFVNGTWVNYANASAANMTHLGEAATYINAVTGNLFGYMLLLTIFIITFVAGSMASRGASLEGFSVSLFLTTIISYLLMGMGLVGLEAAVPLTLGTVGVVILAYVGGGSGGV